MAPSRAYIPSAALLRSLSRPLPRKCSLARRIPTIAARNETVQSAAPKARKEREPLREGVLNESGISAISWYEQDTSGRGPERLISRISTKEELARFERQHKLLEEDEAHDGKNYDDTELRGMLLDELMQNPNFADLQEGLMAMKQLNEARKNSAETEEIEKAMEGEVKEVAATEMMASHEMIQEMINDPGFANCKAELLEIQGKLPEWNGDGDPELEAAMARLDKKLEGNEVFQKKLAAMRVDKEKSRPPDEIIPAGKSEVESVETEMERVEPDMEIEPLLKEMQELLKAMGGDSEIEAELERVRNEDPTKEIEEELEQGVKFETLAKEIDKFRQENSAEKVDESVDPELEAKVDKIMQDPKLMEKLALIKDLITKQQAGITQTSNSAPDPSQLASSETTTLEQQLKIAENDPEHIVALRRLRISLLPPYNISPHLRALNQALKYAYLGANDDIRRILWRAYIKARPIPTLLKNIPDDAWDILWYSQAVTWTGNQNRQNHLRILQRDLASIGRNGPPTKLESMAE